MLRKIMVNSFGQLISGFKELLNAKGLNLDPVLPNRSAVV